MSSFFALLDDMATLAKMAAVQADDIAAQALKATTKATGLVVDDAAAAPQFVTGLAPSRELPIIGKITLGSAKNKALLTGGLMGLSTALAFTPIPIMSVVMPVLMAGGSYLAYEGFEKFFGHHHEPAAEDFGPADQSLPADLEKTKVADAVRTDLILSAEIMAMTFADVATSGLGTQLGVLAATGGIMTVGVYGTVAGLVKMDDMGLALANNKTPYISKLANPLGRGLVRAMPYVFDFLGKAGAAAMLWVGGSMLMHGAAHFGVTGPEHMIEAAMHTVEHALPIGGGFAAWAVETASAAALGLAAGTGIAKTPSLVSKAVSSVKNLLGLSKKADVAPTAPQASVEAEPAFAPLPKVSAKPEEIPTLRPSDVFDKPVVTSQPTAAVKAPETKLTL